MTTFNEREKAYEEAFACDEELKFKTKAKAAKLLANWAATELGLSTDLYITELVNLATSGKDEDALLDKVALDAVNKGKHLSKAAISEKYFQYQNQAHDYLINH